MLQQQQTGPTPFCRMCHLAGQSRQVYASHFNGQPECPSLSERDKRMLAEQRGTQQLGAIGAEDDDDGEDLAQEFGYGTVGYEDSSAPDQVKDNLPKSLPPLKCNFIQPVPAQILTVQDRHNATVHLDLDSGATVSYVKLAAVQKHGFTIGQNSQLSALADGITKMEAIGEVDETFF